MRLRDSSSTCLKLHLRVVLPLRRHNLEQQHPELLLLSCYVVGLDQVPDGLDTGEHLLIGPLEFARGGLDPAIDVLPPLTPHWDTEVCGVDC